MKNLILFNLKRIFQLVIILNISDLLKNSDLKKDILVFNINSKKTIYLVSIKKDLKTI